MRLTVVALLAASALPAQALVLDYPAGSPPVTNASGRIDAAYGDLPGLLDAAHAVVDAQGGITDGLLWWQTGYDNLTGVAWGGQQAGNDFGRVTLAPVGGSTITLNSFQLGIWSGGRGATETVSVFAIGSTTPVFTRSFSENGNVAASFVVNATSSTGFVVQWSAPWWVAIDNLTYTASPVPEPASALLMALGLGAAGLAAARRRG